VTGAVTLDLASHDSFAERDGAKLGVVTHIDQSPMHSISLRHGAPARISVCITHYNRPHLLGSTLESLARQTQIPDEVFLWDDASPQDPSEVVRAFEGRFPRFVYRRNERNLGMPGNLNAVIAQATGDYVVNLHDADVYHPTLLQRWTEALDAFPSAGFVFCRVAGRNESQDRRLRGCLPLTPGQRFNQRYFLNAWRGSSPVWGTVMARRSIYRDALPFAEEYGCVADVDMWMRLSWVADVAFVDEALITAHPSSHFVSGVNWSLVHALRRIHRQNVQRWIEERRLPSWHLLGSHGLNFFALYCVCIASLLRHGRFSSLRGLWRCR